LPPEAASKKTETGRSTEESYRKTNMERTWSLFEASGDFVCDDCATRRQARFCSMTRRVLEKKQTPRFAGFAVRCSCLLGRRTVVFVSTNGAGLWA
jgi:hypothetical protein